MPKERGVDLNFRLRTSTVSRNVSLLSWFYRERWSLFILPRETDSCFLYTLSIPSYCFHTVFFTWISLAYLVIARIRNCMFIFGIKTYASCNVAVQNSYNHYKNCRWDGCRFKPYLHQVATFGLLSKAPQSVNIVFCSSAKCWKCKIDKKQGYIIL